MQNKQSQCCYLHSHNYVSDQFITKFLLEIDGTYLPTHNFKPAFNLLLKENTFLANLFENIW